MAGGASPTPTPTDGDPRSVAASELANSNKPNEEALEGNPSGPQSTPTSTDRPAALYLLTAVVPPNPNDISADMFGQPYDLQPGTFNKPTQIKWVPLDTNDPPVFEEGEVTVKWIANVNGTGKQIPGQSLSADISGAGGTQGSITLFLDFHDGLDFDGLDMFIVLQYPDRNQPTLGDIVQVSPLFTVTNSSTRAFDLAKSYLNRKTDQDLKLGFELRDKEGLDPLPTGSFCNPLNLDDRSCDQPFPASTSSANGDNSTPKISSSSKESSNKGGLSTAAKAGVGVGVGILGLLLIALIVFILFRRRQRRRSDNVHSIVKYDASAPVGTDMNYIADKEMSGPRLAESPYSEEDGRGGALLGAHHPLGEFQHESSPRGFAPYSDAAAPHAVTTDGRVESRTGARSSTPERAGPVPTSVAHLVEDGMTEEQIRRLEEEERALDQAIEQAGHTGR